MNSPDNNSVNVVKTKVEEICTVVNAQTRSQGRKQKTYVIFGALAIIASCFSLFSLTTTASKLDAQALTQIARVQVESQLPDGRESVKEYLESEAPALVERIVESLLAMIPQLRGSLVGGISEKTTAFNAEFETHLARKLEASLRGARSEIDRAFPNASNEEKLEKLVAFVARQFGEAVEVCLNEIYPQYSSEMNRLRSYLVDLNRKSPEELTESERTHKEIFETLLRLMIREHSVAPK